MLQTPLAREFRPNSRRFAKMKRFGVFPCMQKGRFGHVVEFQGKNYDLGLLSGTFSICGVVALICTVAGGLH